ncbi:nuclear transport factor 2 family protein [Streptomyces sp. NBC_00009]|uniref:nuclear transport factor 2 family protein n=1 Tax=Streptomyces sp. NBC_00009 TaxID=2975620 RepID=UPI00324E59D9
MPTTTLTPDQRRIRNMAALNAYFYLLEEGDLDSWIDLWADNCTQIVPYAAGELPRRLTGKDEIHTLYKSIAGGFTKLTFQLTELHPLQDPDKIFARWQPYIELLDGSFYSNESVGLFEFDEEGRIRHFSEYFNPSGFVENYDTFS